MSERVFLATTALEEFWDTSRPMLFLGEWCLRYSRRSFWEPLQKTVCEPLWKNPARAREAYHASMAAYERLLPIVAAELNRVHEAQHSLRYWRIVIGPWLLFYTHMLYDRYASLKDLRDRGVEFETIGLSEDSFVTPSDTQDFISRADTDLYNLQVYSRILQELGYRFPAKRMQEESSSLPKRKRSLKARLQAFLTEDTRLGRGIVLYNAYFSVLNGFKLALKTGFLVRAFNRGYQALEFAADREGRRSFCAESHTGDAFVDLTLRLLPLDLPACFLEGFALQGERIGPKAPPRAILAANPWYFDEVFKRWAARCSEKGTKLFGVQHGGNYGSMKHLYALDHEVSIVDRYVTWGWSGENASIVPFFSPKLVGSGKVERSNLGVSGILLVLTSQPRYLQAFPFVPSFFAEAMRWQERFYSSLQCKEALRIRPHAADYGWDLRERLRNNCPGAKLEDWTVSFGESLQNCRLYVCDHLSTTFIEALVNNKPTILFWNPEFNELTTEAKPYYEALRGVGILHDSPEAAARKVDEVYETVDGWWNELERQAAVRQFCDRFGRSAPDALDRWVKKLGSLLDERSLAHGHA